MITAATVECPVCYDERTSTMKVWCSLPCNHVTCLECLVRIMHRSHATCPLCRTVIPPLTAEFKRPESEVTPVSLNIQTLLDEDGIDAIVRRVQATSNISTAVVAGAAPRNRLTSLWLANAPSSSVPTPEDAPDDEDVTA